MSKRINEYKCCVSGCYELATGQHNGKPYCNKHWLRIYRNGDLKIHSRKIETKYIRHKTYAEGITSKGVHFKFDLSDWNTVTKHSWTCSNGYFVCTYAGHQLRLHRLVTHAHGKDHVVDHINGDTHDNRKSNLRITTQKNNSRNTKVSKNNSTGVTGVGLTPTGKYRARIMVNRNEIRLGTFKTIGEAALARKRGEAKYFGEFARKQEATFIYPTH